MNLNLDSNFRDVLMAMCIAATIVLLVFFGSNMFVNNADGLQKNQEAQRAAIEKTKQEKIKACRSISSERLRRDCLSGPGVATTPAYADDKGK